MQSTERFPQYGNLDSTPIKLAFLSSYENSDLLALVVAIMPIYSESVTEQE